MRKLLLLLLLLCPVLLVAQSRTVPAKETNNTFTGINVFTRGLSLDAGANGNTRGANDSILEIRRHATDCTAITDGKDGEVCWEKDANAFYVCEPSAGLCDTPGEWIPATASGGTSHSLLSATHSDSTTATVVRGDLIVGKGGSPTWQRLALGATKKVLSSDGTDADYRYVQLRTHATDCTALTDGNDGEACYEQDSNRIFVCEPTSGLCDTPGEWMSTNTPTLYTYNELIAAGKNGSSGSSAWDLDTTLAPTAGVDSTTVQFRGRLEWPDVDGDYQAQNSIWLPPNYDNTRAITMEIVATTENISAGNYVWQAAIKCQQMDGTAVMDLAFNTASTVTQTSPTVANRKNTATIASLDATSCSPNYNMQIKLMRNRTHASDTLTGKLYLIKVRMGVPVL